MTWNFSGGSAKFAFAMIANGNARFIEFDATGGSETIGSGTIESADTTTFSTNSIVGDYAFGVAGLDNLNNRAAIVGRFTSNGTGTLTSAAGDLNAYGTPYSLSFTAANYTVSDTKTGRGTMNLAFTLGGAPANLNFVFYSVNGKRLFAMERDTVTTSTPLLNGTVVQQQTPAVRFSNISLSGNTGIYPTGRRRGDVGTETLIRNPQWHTRFAQATIFLFQAWGRSFSSDAHLTWRQLRRLRAQAAKVRP